MSNNVQWTLDSRHLFFVPPLRRYRQPEFSFRLNAHSHRRFWSIPTDKNHTLTKPENVGATNVCWTKRNKILS
jgi:hypothetical protein